MVKRKMLAVVLNNSADFGMNYLTSLAEQANTLGDVGAQYLDDLCAALFAAAHQEVAA